MRRGLIRTVFIVLVTLNLTVYDIAAQDQDTKAQSKVPNEIVRNLTCPAEVTVGSVRNLGRWVLPTSTARYADVKLEIRDLGGREYYSAVCSYAAYNSKVSIERVMGQKNALRNCKVFAVQGGPGGVQCN